jgi:hypothetical protein
MLTTDQIQRLAFTSAITARHRLQELVGLELLECFRPYAERGSHPNHFILAKLGAAVVAAQNPDLGAERVKLIQRRADLDQRLATMPEGRLAHLKGVNDFYLGLRDRAARVPDAGLVRWLGERGFGDWYGDGFRSVSRRPDAYGHWREGAEQTRFLLEYDRGTEKLERLAGKLDGYHRFFHESAGEAFLRDCGPPWLVFSFLSEQREHNARPVLRTAEYAGRLSVATGVVLPGADPGGRLWLPLDSGSGERCALAGLPVAGSPRKVPELSYRVCSRPAEPPSNEEPEEEPVQDMYGEELEVLERAREAQESEWGQGSKSRWGRRGHG